MKRKARGDGKKANPRQDIFDSDVEGPEGGILGVMAVLSLMGGERQPPQALRVHHRLLWFAAAFCVICRRSSRTPESTRHEKRTDLRNPRTATICCSGTAHLLAEGPEEQSASPGTQQAPVPGDLRALTSLSASLGDGLCRGVASGGCYTPS
ncbi:hypothetical protein NDU88_000690 [Pleurodeles waltl]|uniref:Uncharacterized protein n=1 Tax=Pleurodeles waltl TaxID=8319 RepID=A0AAV7U471_PLEWA|nr:hypothetical protein NDU88_000690 [Pleurodeles waltl]